MTDKPMPSLSLRERVEEARAKLSADPLTVVREAEAIVAASYSQMRLSNLGRAAQRAGRLLHRIDDRDDPANP